MQHSGSRRSFHGRGRSSNEISRQSLATSVDDSSFSSDAVNSRFDKTHSDNEGLDCFNGNGNVAVVSNSSDTNSNQHLASSTSSTKDSRKQFDRNDSMESVKLNHISSKISMTASAIGNAQCADELAAVELANVSGDDVDPEKTVNFTNLTLLKDYVHHKEGASGLLNALHFHQSMLASMRSTVLLRSVPSFKHLQLTSEAAEAMTVQQVAKIRKFKMASAFIIAPGILATNHHVISLRVRATHPSTRVLFDFEDESDPRKGLSGKETPIGPGHLTGKLRPDLFFFSDPSLDITLVGFEHPSDEYIGPDHSLPPSLRNHLLRPPLRLQYNSVQDALLHDGRLCILQHPGGAVTQVSLHGSCIHGIEQEKQFFIYTSDTSKGSSGSPIFDVQWNFIGIHHTAVTKKVTKKTKKGGVIAAKVSRTSYNQGTYSRHIFLSLYEEWIREKTRYNDLCEMFQVSNDGSTSSYSSATTNMTSLKRQINNCVTRLRGLLSCLVVPNQDDDASANSDTEESVPITMKQELAFDLIFI